MVNARTRKELRRKMSADTQPPPTQLFVSADFSINVKLYELDRFYLQATQKTIARLNLKVDTKRYHQAE
jgi:hypothetical protein